MFTQPQLSEREWSLVLDLLKMEQRELPPEIHHSERGPYRDELQERKVTINDLVQRLEFVLTTAGHA